MAVDKARSKEHFPFALMPENFVADDPDSPDLIFAELGLDNDVALASLNLLLEGSFKEATQDEIQAKGESLKNSPETFPQALLLLKVARYYKYFRQQLLQEEFVFTPPQTTDETAR